MHQMNELKILNADLAELTRAWVLTARFLASQTRIGQTLLENVSFQIAWKQIKYRPKGRWLKFFAHKIFSKIGKRFFLF